MEKSVEQFLTEYFLYFAYLNFAFIYNFQNINSRDKRPDSVTPTTSNNYVNFPARFLKCSYLHFIGNF